MTTSSIGFIGGGRITKIFLEAFDRAGRHFQNIAVYDPDTNILSGLQQRFPFIQAQSESLTDAAASDIVILAVHPPALKQILPLVKPFLRPGAVVLSLAPKITIHAIKDALSGFGAVARSNPSAPGIINQGMNPVAFNDSMDEAARNRVLDILRILGSAPVVEESKIEAYAVVGAMGSTYFWFQFEKLRELGLKFGLTADDVCALIPAMVRGTAETLFNSGLPAGEVMDLVPVRPLADHESAICAMYDEKLNGIFEKIKP